MPLRPDSWLRVKTKKSSFSRFMAIFMTYCPYFSSSKAFAWLVRPDTCLRGMTKKSPFSRFMVVLMSYCPQFWVLGRFAWLVRPDTCLGVRTKNSLSSRFMVVFMSYFPHFLGSGAICMPHKTRYMFEIYDQKLVSFALYGHFHELLP